MTFVYIAVEGDTDIPVAERLIKHVGLEPLPAITARSAAKLDQRFTELNRSGRALNWLVLRDLDAVACAPELLDKLLAGVALSERVCVRVPVREIESWLLADVEGFAAAFSVRPSRMIASPDELNDPKRHVVEVCRHSRSRAVRDTVPPRPGSGRSVGAEYASRISDFARRSWNIESAAPRSPSLARALSALRSRVARGVWR